MRILVIEDDKKIASFVGRGLKEAGFAVDQAENGEDGLRLALTHPYDAAVVDLMLPRLDGLTLIDELRVGWRLSGLGLGARLGPFRLHLGMAFLFKIINRHVLTLSPDCMRPGPLPAAPS